MSAIRQTAERRAVEKLREVGGGSIFRESYPDYTILPEHNLVPGIELGDFWSDLAAGAGSELHDSERGPAKFCAAYSSSALAVNSFAPFRRRPRELLIAGIRGFEETRFEKTLPTGLGGTPPHLDFFASTASYIVCIESKFLEPLWSKTAKFAESYETAIESLAEDSWADVYRTLKAEPQHFRCLDAAQLVKHYLGMRNSLVSRERRLVLAYVYWEPENAQDIAEFRLHRDEIAEFSQSVRNSAVKFKAMSYRQLWNEWRRTSSWHGMQRHVSNLENRYAFSI